MLKDILQARHLGGHKLHLRFEDGVEGDVDLEKFLKFTGVFEPLKDPAYVGRVRVEPEYGTIAWPNGADLDPDVLYSMVVREAIPPYGDA